MESLSFITIIALGLTTWLCVALTVLVWVLWRDRASADHEIVMDGPSDAPRTPQPTRYRWLSRRNTIPHRKSHEEGEEAAPWDKSDRRSIGITLPDEFAFDYPDPPPLPQPLPDDELEESMRTLHTREER
jgi:hypothetical protein